MKKYKIDMALEVEAGSEQEARQKFAALVQNAQVVTAGWQHSNGEFHDCAPPPEGYTMLSLVSDYYGSHQESGEGDQTLFFAVPNGAAVSEISLSHGHTSTQWEGLALLPTGTLEWVGHKGEWIPFVYQPAE